MIDWRKYMDKKEKTASFVPSPAELEQAQVTYQKFIIQHNLVLPDIHIIIKPHRLYLDFIKDPVIFCHKVHAVIIHLRSIDIKTI